MNDTPEPTEKVTEEAAAAPAEPSAPAAQAPAEPPAAEAEAPAVAAEPPAVEAETPAVAAEPPAVEPETPAVTPEAETEETETPAAPAEAPAEPSFAHKLDLILEALLLAADGPLPLDQMQKLVASEFNLGKKDLRAALERISARYAGSASELHEVATGWRLQVRSEYGEWVGRLWQEKPPKYSRALLETLALIVYRQPITRGEIEDVRGVSVSSNILKTLLERGWVREVGHKEVPGRPALYGTTPQFLDDFNLKSLDQLPTLPEIKDLEQLEAAMARLGQSGAEAVAAIRAERQAAEQPIGSGDSEEACDPAEREAAESVADTDAGADSDTEAAPPHDATLH